MLPSTPSDLTPFLPPHAPLCPRAGSARPCRAGGVLVPYPAAYRRPGSAIVRCAPRPVTPSVGGASRWRRDRRRARRHPATAPWCVAEAQQRASKVRRRGGGALATRVWRMGAAHGAWARRVVPRDLPGARRPLPGVPPSPPSACSTARIATRGPAIRRRCPAGCGVGDARYRATGDARPVASRRRKGDRHRGALRGVGRPGWVG